MKPKTGYLRKSIKLTKFQLGRTENRENKSHPVRNERSGITIYTKNSKMMISAYYKQLYDKKN